jgi:AcrR family transcriptional regulator
MALQANNNRQANVKDKILEEAIRLFGENGFEGTSIQNIADAVGIRKPSLLYHYASKEVLRAEAVESLLNHWKTELPRLLANSRSGHDRFSTTVEALINFFLENKNRANLVVREMLDRPASLGDQVKEHLDPYLILIVDYIRMGQGSGIVKPEVDPESYITHVMMMVIGTVALGGVTKAFSVFDNDDTMQPLVKELVRIARDTLFVNSEQTESDK